MGHWAAPTAMAYGIALMGCGGALPAAPAHPWDDPHFAQERPAAPPGLAHDPPLPQMLYPGDVITITSVSSETHEIPNVVVDDQGNAHVPLAGDVHVAGIPISEAETRLEHAVQQYDRFARVSLTITKPEGHRATVLGAIATPGQVPVTPGMRISDAVAAAGGPLVHISQDGEYLPLADLASARVYRDGHVLPISMVLALRGDPKHNVRLHPGDHISIPPRLLDRVAVLGDVNTAAMFPYRDGLRLTEALARAGGLNLNGNLGDVRVVRGSLAHPLIYTANVEDIVSGSAHDVLLQAGDIVYVTREAMGDVGVFLARLSPILSAIVTVGVTAAVLWIPARTTGP